MLIKWGWDNEKYLEYGYTHIPMKANEDSLDTSIKHKINYLDFVQLSHNFIHSGKVCLKHIKQSD